MVVKLMRDPLQERLNQMAARGDGFSAVKKAWTYITAALEFAVDEQLIELRPTAEVAEQTSAEAMRTILLSEAGILRIDEALTVTEKGAARIGENESFEMWYAR
jgi:hypothetical protein